MRRRRGCCFLWRRAHISIFSGKLHDLLLGKTKLFSHCRYFGFQLGNSSLRIFSRTLELVPEFRSLRHSPLLRVRGRCSSFACYITKAVKLLFIKCTQVPYLLLVSHAFIKTCLMKRAHNFVLLLLLLLLQLFLLLPRPSWFWISQRRRPRGRRTALGGSPP